MRLNILTGGSFILFIIVGCSDKLKLPSTLGESYSGFTYVPVDPLPVYSVGGTNCCFDGFQPTSEEEQKQFLPYMKAFPDQVVRMAVGKTDYNGNLSFGPATFGLKGQTYSVILDYIITDVARTNVYAKEEVIEEELIEITKDGTERRTKQKISTYKITPDKEVFDYREDYHQSYTTPIPDQKIKEMFGDAVPIPTYIGVGLRLTADISILEKNANLSSLGAIAGEVSSGNATGRLTVQTLGITGRNVSAALPLPSEINETTIQNAILAIGTIKALLHDSATVITPRVVGFYNNIGGGSNTVKKLISEVTKSTTTWSRPCTSKQCE